MHDMWTNIVLESYKIGSYIIKDRKIELVKDAFEFCHPKLKSRRNMLSRLFHKYCKMPKIRVEWQLKVARNHNLLLFSFPWIIYFINGESKKSLSNNAATKAWTQPIVQGEIQTRWSQAHNQHHRFVAHPEL